MKNYKKLQNGSDIRGVAIASGAAANADLNCEAVRDLTAAFVYFLRKKYGNNVVISVGRDSRLSGPELAAACMDAASKCGADVLDCGMATTPAMFMSTKFETQLGIGVCGAIMITASHLPYDRNGMKFFTSESGLEKEEIAEIIEYAQSLEFVFDGCGRVTETDLMSVYSEHLRELICSRTGMKKPLDGMKIVVDAGNGAGGFYATDVLAPLGADVSASIYLDPDGSFPNHQPNPENDDAVKCICDAVSGSGADLGIIFDTDVDRAAAVDSKGSPIARNGIVAIASVLAGEVSPGTTVVTDSITSVQLHDFIEKKLDLRHFRYRRGYRNVINKGLELNAGGTDCALAIETSGHAAFRDNYFLDDGAYLAALIVSKAALQKRNGKTIEDCLEGLGEPAESKEYRLNLLSDDFAAYADNILKDIENSVRNAEVPGASLELPNYEGVRINFDKAHGAGWLLLRKSLHEPLMPLNIESNEPGGLDRIKNIIGNYLKNYDLLDTSRIVNKEDTK